jgi:hypothetical protein
MRCDRRGVCVCVLWAGERESFTGGREENSRARDKRSGAVQSSDPWRRHPRTTRTSATVTAEVPAPPPPRAA